MNRLLLHYITVIKCGLICCICYVVFYYCGFGRTFQILHSISSFGILKVCHKLSSVYMPDIFWVTLFCVSLWNLYCICHVVGGNLCQLVVVTLMFADDIYFKIILHVITKVNITKVTHNNTGMYTKEISQLSFKNTKRQFGCKIWTGLLIIYLSH